MANGFLGDSAKKIFLMGVGAVAETAERSEKLINDLVKKGELTVNEGKNLNEELTHKGQDFMNRSSDAVLRAKLEAMTPGERAVYAEKVQKMAQDITDEKTSKAADTSASCKKCSDDQASEEAEVEADACAETLSEECCGEED